MFANKSMWDSLILKAGLIDFGLGPILVQFLENLQSFTGLVDIVTLPPLSILTTFSLLQEALQPTN